MLCQYTKFPDMKSLQLSSSASLPYPEQHMQHNQIDHQSLGCWASVLIQDLDHGNILPICPFTNWDRGQMPLHCRRPPSTAMECHLVVWHLWFGRHAHATWKACPHCFPLIQPILYVKEIIYVSSWHFSLRVQEICTVETERQEWWTGRICLGNPCWFLVTPALQ